MSRDAADPVRDEQIKVLYRQGRVVFLPNMVAVPAVAYVLWNQLAQGELLAWGAFMYLITAARSWLVWDYHHRARAPIDHGKWGWRLAAMNAISGAGWGAAGFFFFNGADPVSQAFLVVTIAAMTAGAVGSLSAFLPAYLVFSIPCVVPIIVRALLESRADASGQGTTYFMLAVLAAVYLLVHLAFARNAERALVEGILLRFEKIDLVEQLTVQKERAEAASVAKSKFLAAASHDLRQPMHALGLFIDALRGEEHAPKAARIVENVEGSHQAAIALLDNLLEFSRVDAGVVEPSLQSYPVQRLLDHLRAEYAVQASAADLELRIHPCAVHVRTDPALLSRLVGNLVSNAIRYTEEGRIVIGCRRMGARLRIEVHDTGIGIAPEEHQAIFREFYQVGGRRTARSIGMGLGLAIVAGLAQALEHPVSVASKRGKGSMFAVLAPICAPATSAAPAPQPLVDNLRGKTILFIDDEPAIRDAVVEILLRWGCKPIAASGTREALAALGEHGVRPDAIVVDYQLEAGLTGLDAIASLTTIYGPGIPAIIVTGDTQPERLREVNDIGQPLLYKPLAPMRLRAALSAAISQRTGETVA